jgi:hypothetical protein
VPSGGLRAVADALLKRASPKRAEQARASEDQPDKLPAPLTKRRPRPSKTEQSPEPEPAAVEPPREWNLWELERAVRDAGDAERQVEWSALLIHLREFANADGDLPLEFDGLVRESFGVVLAEAAAS